MYEIENFCVGCEHCINCGRNKDVKLYSCDICYEPIVEDEEDVRHVKDRKGNVLDLCPECDNKLQFFEDYTELNSTECLELVKNNPNMDINNSADVAEALSKFYTELVKV